MTDLSEAAKIPTQTLRDAAAKQTKNREEALQNAVAKQKEKKDEASRLLRTGENKKRKS